MERIDCETLTGGAPCDDEDELDIEIDLPEELGEVPVFSNEILAVEFVGLDGESYRHDFRSPRGRPVAVLLNPSTLLLAGYFEATDRGLEDI